MPESAYTAADFLHAADVVSHLQENMKISFQIDGLKMTREEAQRHFLHRQQLISVNAMLVNEAERVSKA